MAETAMLQALDKAKPQAYHFKAILMAGMGLTDAYKLFLIFLLMKQLGRIYYYNPAFPTTIGTLLANVSAAVTGVALCVTLAGQLLFGWAGDKWGWKKVFGLVQSMKGIYSVRQLITMLLIASPLCLGGNCLTLGQAAILGSTLVMLPAVLVRTYSRLTLINIFGVIFSILFTSDVVIAFVADPECEPVTHASKIHESVLEAAGLQYRWGWSCLLPGLLQAAEGLFMFFFLVVEPANVGLLTHEDGVKHSSQLEAQRNVDSNKMRDAEAGLVKELEPSLTVNTQAANDTESTGTRDEVT